MQEGQQPTEPGWVFRPGEQAQPTPSAPTTKAALPPSSDLIEWTASEYIANPKNARWYSLLVIGSVLLAVVVYLVTKDVISTSVIVILGIIVGVFAARQPKTLHYQLDTSGLQIGEKFYPYEMFKSFSIAQEHAIGFISLLPLKRFMPPIIIHYDPEDEGRIADTLADFLPYEEHKADVVDSLTRRFRF
jgi:hypothetical protein